MRNARRAGFTIVELMVALAIGSVLLLALAAMFIGTSQSRNELDKSSRQIEGGRYAVQVLSDEIRHAGYFGALTNAPTLPGSVTTLPNPCSTTLATVQNSLGLPVHGVKPDMAMIQGMRANDSRWVKLSRRSPYACSGGTTTSKRSPAE